MGSSYHAYTVLGVEAKDYIKSHKLSYKYQRRIDSNLIFDENGTPIYYKRTIDYYSFQDKNFVEDWRVLEHFKIGVIFDGPEIVFEERFDDFIDSLGLKWISYDYERFRDNDVLGLVISEWDSYGNQSNGLDLEMLPKLWIEATKKLVDAGIHENPKLYTRFYHSY